MVNKFEGDLRLSDKKQVNLKEQCLELKELNRVLKGKLDKFEKCK